MHRIYVVPIGKASGAPPAETLAAFLRASTSLEVVPLPASALPKSETGALRRERDVQCMTS